MSGLDLDVEVDMLLGSAIDSLLKLQLLLRMYGRATVLSGADDIAAELGRPKAEVQPALEQLAEAGLIERLRLGAGRHLLYGACEDEHVAELMAWLRGRYYGEPEARAGVARRVLAGKGIV